MTRAEQASSLWRDLLARHNGQRDRALKSWTATLEPEFGPAPVSVAAPRLQSAARAVPTSLEDAVTVTGTPTGITIIIAGEALTANHIWQSVLMPRAKMHVIIATLSGKSASWILANLFRIVRENFRPSVILTKEAAAWKARVTAAVSRRVQDVPQAETYTLTLEFHGRFRSLVGAPLKRDLSNLVKLCEDAVFAGVGLDDSVVFEACQRKIHTLQNPRIIATLEPLTARAQGNLFGGDL